MAARTALKHKDGNGALVLDRLARVGSRLSAAQVNNWTFFNETWDECMLHEHKGNWGRLSAEWSHQIVIDFHNGISNTFSLLVQSETQRCLADKPVLVCP